MLIYVPKAKDGLKDFLLALKNTSMEQIRAQIQKPGNCEKLQLSLPKFRIQSELKLVEPLKKVKPMQSYQYNSANCTYSGNSL